MIAAICYSMWVNASDAADDRHVSNASLPHGHSPLGAAAASKPSHYSSDIQSFVTHREASFASRVTSRQFASSASSKRS